MPIPLTEDVLLKAGFEVKEWVDSKWFKKMLLIRTNNNGECIYEFSLNKNQYDDFSCYMEEQYLGFIKHLHQLQNLIFSISGIELTITL